DRDKYPSTASPGGTADNSPPVYWREYSVRKSSCAGGTTETPAESQPSLTGRVPPMAYRPGVETPGYFQASLAGRSIDHHRRTRRFAPQAEVRPTSSSTDQPNHSQFCTRAANSAASAPSGLRPESTASPT